MAYDPVRISAAEARLICQDLDAVRAARQSDRGESPSRAAAERLVDDAHLVAAQHIVRGYRTDGALLSGELVAVLAPIEHEAHLRQVDEMVGLLLRSCEIDDAARDQMRHRTGLVGRFEAAQVPVPESSLDDARAEDPRGPTYELPLTDLVPRPRRTA